MSARSSHQSILFLHLLVVLPLVVSSMLSYIPVECLGRPLTLECRPSRAPTSCQLQYTMDTFNQHGVLHEPHVEPGHWQLHIAATVPLAGGWYLLRVTCAEATRVCEFHVDTSGATQLCTVADLSFTVTPPRKIFAFEGDYLDLSCQASRNLSRVPVTWWKGTQELVPNNSAQDSGEERNYFVEVGSGRLGMQQMQPQDAGNYTCLARAGGQNITSTTEIISIRHVRLVDPPPNIEVNESSSLNLACQAEGWPLPTVSWLFNSRPIRGLQSFVTNRTYMTTVFHVQTPTKQSHEGWYTCVAESIIDSLRHLIYVRINGEPDKPVVNVMFGMDDRGFQQLVLHWHEPHGRTNQYLQTVSVILSSENILEIPASQWPAAFTFPAHEHTLRFDPLLAETNYTVAVWLSNPFGESDITWTHFTTQPRANASVMAREDKMFGHPWMLVLVGGSVLVVVVVVAGLTVMQCKNYRHSFTRYQNHCRARTESESEIVPNDFNSRETRSRTWSFVNPLFNDDDTERIMASDTMETALDPESPTLPRNITLEYIPSSPIYNPHL